MGIVIAGWRDGILNDMVSALVLDLIPNLDGPREGQIVRAAMENIGWDVRLVEKPRKAQAMDALFRGWKADVIHISSHGSSRSISTSKGEIAIREIRSRFQRSLRDEDTWLDDTLLMVNSSCRGASRSWREFALGELGVHNYIAPEGGPTMVEGIVFPLGLYLELWGRRLSRRTIVQAYRQAFGKYFDETPWQLFPVPTAGRSTVARRSLSDYG
jgi:hypothetical protein